MDSESGDSKNDVIRIIRVYQLLKYIYIRHQDLQRESQSVQEKAVCLASYLALMWEPPSRSGEKIEHSQMLE